LKFLGRARRFFQELASEPEGRVQYFNVTCGSGHRIRGERTEGYQALRCPACGNGVFVLPRSPLPEPAAPSRKPAPKSWGRTSPWVDDGPVELTDPGQVALDAAGDASGPTDAEIIWEDSPGQFDQTKASEQPSRAGVRASPEGEQFWEEDVNRAAAAARSADTADRRRDNTGADDGPARAPLGRGTAAQSGRTARRSNQRVRRRTADVAVDSGRPVDAPAPPGVELRARRKRPSRLGVVLVVVPLLVIATVAWRYRRQRHQEYPVVAERGKIEGIPALEEGNFDKAHQLLSAAKSAVDALGGAVEGADDIRNAADEAAIFVDQSPRSLEEMLGEAGRTDPQLWASKFETLYKGRAILIESHIAAEPEPGRSSSYQIDYVIFPPGGASNFNDQREARPARYGLIDLTGFRLFELARPGKGVQVTFGARLASFQYDPQNDVWLIGLEPGSGVIIKHHKALEALGWQHGIEDEAPPETRP
jgi:DNA-directed RNA polymerase subunit RPC12/RpoP